MYPYSKGENGINSEIDFTIAALRLEQHYSNINNEDVLRSLGFDVNNSPSIYTLEKSLEEYAHHHSSNENSVIGPAVFALGKTCKRQYLGLYQTIMKAFIEKDITVTYQAGIAIENLGVSIFQSVSPFEDTELVKRKAMEYLSHAGD